MNRRTFLKSLTIAGAGVAAGLSIAPKAESAEDKFWSDYGQHIYLVATAYQPYHGYRFYLDPKPIRFHLIDGEWRRTEWA